jgi:DNA polymerase-1|tara:strand:+ start:2554 stop:3510 length:957 start_codon:yes stop_codon:yes gene_type:complete
MKRVLIIDALNMFLRAYIVDPSLSTNGEPIGGFKGSLKILQKLVRMTKPNAVVIVWDGPNGSRKRRTIDKNYKAGRKPIRLNRNVKALTENEEMQNRIWQQTRAIEYFNEMPIIQVMIAEVEADDVISYLSQVPYYDGWQKVIVSNDKDFYQLCNDETVVYRPTSDIIYNKKRIVEELGVHPRNMALARSLVGDASDNLPGIKSVGFKSIQRRLGFLGADKDYTIDDVVTYCEKVDKKLKFHTNIIEGQKIIEHNYRMMQLYSPMLSPQSKDFVRNAVENFECNFNKIEIMKKMRDDGFGELNWKDLELHLNKINSGR